MTERGAPPTPPPPPGGTRPPPSDQSTPRGVVLKGIAGSPGVAVGPALVVGETRAAYLRRHITQAQVDAEVKRLQQAVTDAKKHVREVAARIPSAPMETNAILDAYLTMIGDPMLIDRIEHKIRDDRKCAEWGVAQACEEIAKMFAPADPADRDAYITERRHDVEFVCDRLLRELTGDTKQIVPRLDQPMVVIARDLSPADTAGMVREPVIAFVTEIGTRTSHTSIMARALEIPAVVGAGDALSIIRTGDMVIVDGLRGEVVVNPNEITIEEARGRGARHLAFARGLLSARNQPCVTRDGEPVSLKANVELPAEAILALDHGAEGIGLYRTEFIYIDRTTMPTEEEQYELYRAVVEAVSPRPVTLRTFDIGGDKFASSFQLPAEMNPALGLRAVRLALSRPDVFLTQLRAMVRASAHGELRIMVPMVASVQELREVRKLVGRAMQEVDAAGHARAKHIPLGIMIEVPSAVVMADVLAREAEFFSIGTNDLIQYTLAIDRGNRSLAPLASPFHPAILRMIRQVARAASPHGVPVALCGAMASDPLAAVLLVGLGLRELSMEAAAIPEIKEALRRVTTADCERAAEAALGLDTADAVEELIAGTFAPGLFDLLTGTAEAGTYSTEDDSPRPPAHTIPDSE
ncbi:MAG TPA: phosphoenolpyruvate--protein phosphotransferase [Polyangiaceae bacterium]|nr:phosphoenolpyruvate--protein phosphotransferase [Polyangiaceae bacterium]